MAGGAAECDDLGGEDCPMGCWRDGGNLLAHGISDGVRPPWIAVGRGRRGRYSAGEMGGGNGCGHRGGRARVVVLDGGGSTTLGSSAVVGASWSACLYTGVLSSDWLVVGCVRSLRRGAGRKRRYRLVVPDSRLSHDWLPYNVAGRRSVAVRGLAVTDWCTQPRWRAVRSGWVDTGVHRARVRCRR